MTINEVFPNPTVKKVIFEIRFPVLFYIENKIGDLQMRVMEQFPESALALRRQLVFADVGENGKIESVPEDLEKEAVTKIWQFKSEKKYEFGVKINSLYITSEHHKTYQLDGADKFKDTIKFVVDNFLELTKIPIISRIGLRYIDECPIPAKENKKFKEYYDSAFPLDRFNLADAVEINFRTTVKRDKYNLRYIESLKEVDGEYKLVLDFDGFAEKIKPDDYLKVTDALHKIISDEYEKTIKEPVIKYMKQKKED